MMTLLDERLGLRVHSDQISVSQSRLSREELKRLLGRRSSSRSAAETGSVGPSGNHPRPSAGALSRFSLVDLSIVAHGEDRHEVGVRISGGPYSADGRCKASGGGVELLQPLAEATVDAVGQLLGRYGRKAALKLKGVHRFGKRLGEGVVVLVEATADGRKELLSGTAFAADSFERAAVVASLQATNTLVAGVLGLPHAHEDQLEAEAGHSGQAVSKTAHAPLPPNASAAPLNPSPDKPSSSSKTISMPSAPDEYVSEVLSRIRSSGELDQASPPS